MARTDRKGHVWKVGHASDVERRVHIAVGVYRVPALGSLAGLHALLGRSDEADDAVRLVMLPEAVHFHGKIAGSAVLAEAVLVECDVSQLARQQPRHRLQRVLHVWRQIFKSQRHLVFTITTHNREYFRECVP